MVSSILDPMEWIIFNYMSEVLFFTPLRNRTRVPVTAIVAIWLACEL